MNTKRLLFSTLFMLSAIVSFAQQVFTTSGVVVDETGETIIGATVQVVGDSKLITATDMAVSLHSPISSLVLSWKYLMSV